MEDNLFPLMNSDGVLFHKRMREDGETADQNIELMTFDGNSDDGTRMDVHMEIENESPAITTGFYHFLKCNFCGSTRRLTFMCDICHELLCENCSFGGKCAILKLKKTLFTLLDDGDLGSIVPNPNPTLNDISEYTLKELLPILECDYAEEDRKSINKIEPNHQSRNQLSPDNLIVYESFFQLIKNKEKERTNTKSRTGMDSKSTFSSKSRYTDTLALVKTSDIDIQLQLLVRDDAIYLMYISATHDTHMHIDTSAKVLDVNHMQPDYSDPLNIKIVAGYVAVDGERFETFVKSLNVFMAPESHAKQLVKMNVGQLHNKGFFSSLFTSNKNQVKHYFFDVRVSLFLLDAYFSTAYDEVLNRRIQEMRESNELRYRELKESVKNIMKSIEGCRILKEEVSTIRQKCNDNLKTDKVSALDSHGLSRLLSVKLIFGLFFFGMYVQLAILVNPTLFNTMIFS